MRMNQRCTVLRSSSASVAAVGLIIVGFFLIEVLTGSFALPVLAAGGPLPIFPGASGFGTTTPAGSGRHRTPPRTTIIKITSLADSGSGTLRECIKFNSPRTCVFEVGGRIQLASELLVTAPYLTIAGESAPAPGILLAGAGLRVATHDVLVRHLQIRVGDAKTGPKPETRDGVTVAGKSGTEAKNVVLDHLSVSWAIDENLSVWYPTSSDVTISHSIVSEALYRSIHPKGPHSMGVLLGDGVKRVSLHDNLFAENFDRNPRMKPGSETEFFNNVVYGWGGTSSWNQANLSDAENVRDATLLAFAGNFYRPGPWSPKGATVYGKPASTGSRVYALSNLGPTRTSDTQSEWRISSLTEQPYRALTPPFALSGVLPSDPTETLQSVLRRVGSRPRESNVVDDRVISEVTLLTGKIKDCVTGCSRAAGGYPSMPTTRRILTIPDSPLSDDDGDGYTNLEEWLQNQAEKLEER